MSIAGRHGKLHAIVGDDEGWHQRVEDLLTADVFGAYRYLPPGLGVLALLGAAENADGVTLAAWQGEQWESLQHVDITFWPRLNGREPDLLVSLGAEDARPELFVLVEAKLHSDQHWIEGRSQLGYYGELVFDEEALADVLDDVELPERRPVVFLTKDAEAPTAALARAREELRARMEVGSTDVFWTSWHRAREQAEAALALATANGEPTHLQALLADLLEDLAERGFTPPRPRVFFPLPVLHELETRGVEAWLRRSVVPPRPGPTFRFENAQLDRIDDFLRDWRLR